jgi:predicted nucleotidyltransferase component of viral defense system
MPSGRHDPPLPREHAVSRVIKDRTASIRNRLLNLARESGTPFNEMLQRYAIERFLHRLSQSAYRDRLVLKGAQMLVVWQNERARPSMDIEFLGFTDDDPDAVKRIIMELCRANEPSADGIVFVPESVSSIRIKEAAEYEGVRTSFSGNLGTARIHMQIDMGFNDKVTPAPALVSFPSLLNLEEPRLRSYNPESLIAEKYEAITQLGELNSRMKDFFDIWLLSRTFTFEQQVLRKTFEVTFKQRGTDLVALPAILTPDFPAIAEKQIQWRAFITKSRLDYAPSSFSEVTAAIRLFTEPVVTGLITGDKSNARWNPPGPWESPPRP